MKWSEYACDQCGIVYGESELRTAWAVEFYGPGYCTNTDQSPYVTWRELCSSCYEKYADPETHEYLPEGVKKKGGKK